jgi:predicted transposase YbfD/YdcC
MKRVETLAPRTLSRSQRRRDFGRVCSGISRPPSVTLHRRSHDRKKGLGALHSVSVWASDLGLTLAQVACNEKSNEITAIPELLRLVDAKGAIITIDAMGAQKAIADEVIRGGADYVLALKGNQEALHQAVIAHIDEQLEGDAAGSEPVTEERGHGRVEQRTYLQLPAPRGPDGEVAVERAEVGRRGDVALPPRRKGKHRSAVLHQQSGRRREAIRSRRAVALTPTF